MNYAKFGLYAKSFDKETLCDKIKPICNLTNGEFQLPALKHLYNFRVVVSTLSTSGCLVRAREEEQGFDSSHFRRIIIDEAACCHELTSLIPIAGLFLIFYSTFEKRLLKVFLNLQIEYNIIHHSIQVYVPKMVLLMLE